MSYVITFLKGKSQFYLESNNDKFPFYQIHHRPQQTIRTPQLTKWPARELTHFHFLWARTSAAPCTSPPLAWPSPTRTPTCVQESGQWPNVRMRSGPDSAPGGRTMAVSPEVSRRHYFLTSQTSPPAKLGPAKTTVCRTSNTTRAELSCLPWAQTNLNLAVSQFMDVVHTK